VVLAVILAVFGWRLYSQRQTVKATAAFDEASKIFNARIRLPNTSEEPGEVTYVDEKNKFADAAKKFEEVAGSFPRTRPGLIAKYYAGLSYEHLAQYEDALKWFAQVQGGGDAEVASLARLRTARVYELTGKNDEAAKVYQQLIDRPTTMVPKPLAMLALADLQVRSNPAEAEKLYLQITAEFPQSEVSRAAQERLDEMPPKT